MIFTQTELPEVILISPEVFSDERGAFWEVHHQNKYAEHGIPDTFLQDNQSISRRSVLRGLHYQVVHPQGKLVRVVQGRVFDVAVDIRKSSPNFGRWVGCFLSSRNKQQLWIPPGFAHGFYSLSRWAHLSYKNTELYSSEHDRTLLWNDPRLGIEWPLIDGKPPFLSEKDANAVTLDKAEVFD
ncbi:MAG: dTDP-4-dehydrorhamnose 3,5-epimerase [Anaerolineaceae bacterium]|nr:dTDP-4-dehydrorhamnose 3,5-epimerase [Anaerolineaceae bacterium]